MSSIVGALTGGGGKGMAWNAEAVPIQAPATEEQALEQYGNVQTGLEQQQAFLQALQAQNGIANQSNVFNQLQNVASGQGPNPAQAMLANTTGQNVANQAALMASQRGSSTNPALIARQAAQQGANIQQNAAGQAAALQAQQSLGALGQMGGIAGQQVGQQAAATSGYSQAAQAAQQNILNAIAAQNNARVGMQSNVNTANAALQGQVAQQQGALMGNVMGALGLGAKGMAEGGEVKPAGPKSNVGRYLFANGGKVPALVSPGETYLTPKEVEQVKQGANPLKVGERIPGQPKYPGNNYANDTVPKNLDVGGVVIPNSIMQSNDAAEKAARFVAAVSKKSALNKGK